MELLGSGVDGRNRSAGSFGQVSRLSSIGSLCSRHLTRVTSWPRVSVLPRLRGSKALAPARFTASNARWTAACRTGTGGALQFRCSAEARGPCARGSIHLREVADHSAHTMSVCRGCESDPAPLTGPQMCLVKPIDANSRIRGPNTLSSSPPMLGTDISIIKTHQMRHTEATLSIPVQPSVLFEI